METIAEQLSNYRVVPLTRTMILGPALPLSRAEYDSAGRSVTLVPTRPLKLNTFFQITIQSTLTDVEGNPLGSPGAGMPGVNSVTTLGIGTRLSYLDSNSDAVSLTLAQGGLMVLDLLPNREAGQLRLLDTVADRSVLSGTIRRPRSGGDGITTIQSITAPTSFVNRLPSSFRIGAQVAAVVDELLTQEVQESVDRWGALAGIILDQSD